MVGKLVIVITYLELFLKKKNRQRKGVPFFQVKVYERDIYADNKKKTDKQTGYLFQIKVYEREIYADNMVTEGKGVGPWVGASPYKLCKVPPWKYECRS